MDSVTLTDTTADRLVSFVEEAAECDPVGFKEVTVELAGMDAEFN